MANFFVFFINFYQKTLSPDHSFWGKRRFPYGYCRFYPSCSEYGKMALMKHGIWKGFLKMIFRVLRCNPFSAGGIDPA